MKRSRRTWWLAGAACIAALAACSTIGGLSALQDVRFELGSVSGVRLAGMDLDGVESYEDISPIQVGMLAAGLMAGNVPLDLDLGVRATNPGTVEAALTRMDWTLLLAERETVSGTLDRAYAIPPGATTDIPVHVSVNLVEFFGRNLPQLVQLGLAAAGESSEPVEVGLRVKPTIDTPLGAMPFPVPITVLRQMVGGPAR